MTCRAASSDVSAEGQQTNASSGLEFLRACRSILRYRSLSLGVSVMLFQLIGGVGVRGEGRGGTSVCVCVVLEI